MQTAPLNLSTKYTNTQIPDFGPKHTSPSPDFKSEFARYLLNPEVRGDISQDEVMRGPKADTYIKHMHIDEVKYNQPQAVTHHQPEAIGHTKPPALTHTQPRALAQTQTSASP